MRNVSTSWALWNMQPTILRSQKITDEPQTKLVGLKHGNRQSCLERPSGWVLVHCWAKFGAHCAAAELIRKSWDQQATLSLRA